MTALNEDFIENKQLIGEAISRYELVEESTRRLLSADQSDSGTIEHENFYYLLAQTSRAGTPPTVRQAYDALIATGDIEYIRSEQLKVQLASYYSNYEEMQAFADGVWQFDRMIFEPYVMQHLDHVAMLAELHPSSADGVPRIHPEDQFRAAVGTVEFKSIISGKWRIAGDLLSQFRFFDEKIDEISELISEELAAGL